MKRIVIVVLILAGILDFLSYQGFFDKNKLYIAYEENGKFKEKRYFPKDIHLHVDIQCPSYTFYRLRLINPDNVFIFPDWVSGQNGKPYYQTYSDLEEGNYTLEVIDNFGIHQSRPIRIGENRILTYDDIMDLLYPKDKKEIVTNNLAKEDTLKFNITEDDMFCSGYNGMLYEDSLEVLTLELFQKNNARIEDEVVKVNVFKLDNDFLLYLNSMEQELELESEEKNPKKYYETFEFIFNNRRVYHIPITYSNSFKSDFLDMINEFSYKNEWKKVSRY